jgi:hypothetical protein
MGGWPTSDDFHHFPSKLPYCLTATQHSKCADADKGDDDASSVDCYNFTK